MFAVEDGAEARHAARWMGVDPQQYPHIAEWLSGGLSPRTGA